MPRKLVSEKTLELNICAEVLQLIRRMPRCQGAFWIGMKQDQEARLGIDELIANIPSGMHLALQVKSPWSIPRDQPPYRFTINDRQNLNLLRLATIRPDAVYYILPQYNTFTKMRAASPHLLGDTWLLKVHDLQGMKPATNRQGTHKVETNPPVANVYSDPQRIEVVDASRQLETIFGYSILEATRLLSHWDLKEWLNELIEEAKGNKRVVGQWLRGFSTFCVT